MKGLRTGFVFLIGIALLCLPARAATAADGCGCTLDVYRQELEQVRSELARTLSGTSDEAKATSAAWGLNPCTVGPLSHPTRYAFDFPSESTDKCHDHCEAEPWKTWSDSWAYCAGGKRSFCGPKAGVADHGCAAKGSHLDDCRADPACEVKDVAVSLDRCLTVPGRVIESGHCYFDECTRLKSCSTGWRESCKVNCNDCQMMTVETLRHRHYQCFAVEPIETYYPKGNYARRSHFLTAGTHSMVHLVPKPGSIAELMAPQGFVADALEGVQLRRITSEKTVQESGSVDRQTLTLTPREKDDFSLPLELLPHRFFTGPDEVTLSSGCRFRVPLNPDNRANLITDLEASLISFYSFLQQDACQARPGAAADYVRALGSIRQSAERYAEGLAGL